MKKLSLLSMCLIPLRNWWFMGLPRSTDSITGPTTSLDTTSILGLVLSRYKPNVIGRKYLRFNRFCS